MVVTGRHGVAYSNGAAPRDAVPERAVCTDIRTELASALYGLKPVIILLCVIN